MAKWRTKNPRIYAGRWIVNHWPVCKRTPVSGAVRPVDGSYGLEDAA
jgi:hypothetical protein